MYEKHIDALTPRLCVLALAGLVFSGLIFGISRALPPFVAELPNALVERDFSNLWLAGRLVLRGETASIYDIAAFQSAMRDILGATFENNYSYPPHSLFLATAFGWLPYGVALALWDIGSLLVFFAAARPYLREAPWWAALFSPAAVMSLVWGHYGLLCGALWLWSFRRHGWAAAALTIKPHLGLFVAVQALRDRRMAIAAIAGTIFLVALSALVFGVASWRAWSTVTFDYQVGLLGGRLATMKFSSVAPIQSYGVIGQLVFASAGAFLLTRNFNVFTAATATFLILPYGFHYDLTVVCLGFAYLLATQWNALSMWERASLMLAFIVPALVNLGAWTASPLLLGGLAVQSRYSITSTENQLRAATISMPVSADVWNASVK